MQGTDYAYTLQGWIKGVNSQYLSKDVDMGKDGLPAEDHNLDHSVVAPGVFEYTLDYFHGDYWAVADQSFLPFKLPVNPFLIVSLSTK